LMYLLDELYKAGVKNVIFIVNQRSIEFLQKFWEDSNDLSNYLKKKNREHLMQTWLDYKRHFNFEYMLQDPNIAYGNGAPILTVYRHIGKMPVLYIFGDDIVLQEYASERLVKTFAEKDLDVLLGAFRVPLSQVSKYGVFRVTKQEGDLAYFDYTVEKPSVKEAPSNIVMFGRLALGTVFADFFEDMYDQIVKENSELLIQPALTRLAQERGKSAVLVSRGQWVTVGDPVNYANAWQVVKETFSGNV